MQAYSQKYVFTLHCAERFSFLLLSDRGKGKFLCQKKKQVCGGLQQVKRCYSWEFKKVIMTATLDTGILLIVLGTIAQALSSWTFLLKLTLFLVIPQMYNWTEGRVFSGNRMTLIFLWFFL